MNKKYNCFALLFCLCLCFVISISAQTKIDWKQIKNIPKKLEFEDMVLDHLIFNSAYQPVMDTAHQGAIYYDNQLERLRVYENGEWRDLAVTIASDSIGAPLVILGYLQASDIYASKSAYIGKDINVKGNINGSGTANLNSLKVYKTFKVPTTASTTLGVGSIYYDTTTNKLKVLNSNNQWEVVSINVDTDLSATSTNPLENRAIYSKFDTFEANVAHELEQALLDAYDYANGIATKSYNYTNAVATNTKNYADNAANNASNSAYTAARQYADSQIQIIDNEIKQVNINMLASLSLGMEDTLSSATKEIDAASASLNAQFNNSINAFDNSIKAYISEKLSSGTSDLYVKSIKTTNASVTNKLNANTGEFYDINVSNRVTASETKIQSANINKDLVIGNHTIGGQYIGKYTYRFNSSNDQYRQNQTNALLMGGAHFYAPLTVYGKFRADGSFILPVKRQSELRDVETGYMYFDLDTNKVNVYNGSEFVALDSSGGSGTSYEVKNLAIPLYGIGKNANNVYVWGECYAYSSSGYYKVVCYVTEENTISNNNVISTRLTVDPTPRILPNSNPPAGVSGDNMVDIGPVNQIANSQVLTPGFICRFNSYVYDRSGNSAQSAIGQKGGFNNATNISVEQGHSMKINTSCMDRIDGSTFVYNVIDGDIKYYSGGVQSPDQGSFPPNSPLLFTKDGKNISYESNWSLRYTTYYRDAFSAYIWNITW